MSEENRDTKPVRIPTVLHSEIKADAAANGEKLGEAVVEQLRKKWPGNSHQRRTQRRRAKRP